MERTAGTTWLPGAVVLLLALGASGAGAQSFPTEFKNLQVLKGISPDSLKTTMEGFTQALGVKCTFCHARDQWDKDDNNNKLQARKMIRLVQFMKANKAKYFKADVSDDLLRVREAYSSRRIIPGLKPPPSYSSGLLPRSAESTFCSATRVSSREEQQKPHPMMYGMKRWQST